MTSLPTISRGQVLRQRVRAQQLDTAPSSLEPAEVGILDVGVQDTGSDGAAWALALRGARRWRPGAGGVGGSGDDLTVAWTLRGAPHVYRRAELASVAAQVMPLSNADAAKRIFDASKPLRAAGTPVGEALATVAERMRDIVREPMVKGDVSAALTAVLPEPYLRHCRPCQAIHAYEQPFRLAALYAGLTLDPGTSPPVLRPIPGWDDRIIDALRCLPDTMMSSTPEAERADLLIERLVQVLGPVTVKDLATFVDGSVRDLTVRWRALHEAGRLVDVEVEGVQAAVLPDDATAEPARDPTAGAVDVRLLGPFDLFLQVRDRELLVPDASRRKALWPVLGRPGAVLSGGEIIGTWRPRASGRKLRLLVEKWQAWSTRLDEAVDEQGERLAAHRGVEYAGRA